VTLTPTEPQPVRRTTVNTWDDALDHFEASVAALSDALATGDWEHLTIEPLLIDEAVGPTDDQLARLRDLDAQWKVLEPLLLDALAALDAEIDSLGQSRRGRTEYARFA
jgi:hypothetical protein